MWSHFVAFQGPDEMATVYRIVGLPQFKKEQEEGVLVNTDKLLG